MIFPAVVLTMAGIILIYSFFKVRAQTIAFEERMEAIKRGTRLMIEESKQKKEKESKELALIRRLEERGF